jgi:catechol 2,3-dioxygenase-like lactoylglutathione lyase family enzyme
MPVRGLDHVAITVVDVEATIDFYIRVLGAELVYADLWRAGKLPVAVMQIGASRMNVHDVAKPAMPNAHVATPGSEDFCFRWDGAIEDAIAHLRSVGVEIIEGPVPRPAADGVVGQSVYFRDPDMNLVEFLTTS